MKVLYVRASDIYNDSRATKEIEALIEKGLKVYVLGWDKHGNAEEKSQEVFGNNSIELNFFESSVQGGLGLKNIKEIIKWRKHIINTIKMIKPDIVHACDLLAGGLLYAYCKKKKINYIYDMFDSFADSHDLPELVNCVFRVWEDSVVTNSYATIICTNERKEQIKNAHPNRIVVIHNSPDVAITQINEVTTDYIYCGTLSEGRLIKEIFCDYEKNSDIKFEIAGVGEFGQSAQTLAEKYANFNYKGAISYAEVLEAEKKAAVISAIYNPTLKNHQLCAPNKFYEAMALGKPIIVCKGTGIDKVVEQNQIGVVIDYDADQFYDALRYLLNDKEESVEMGKRGREMYENNYKWSIMKDRLWKLYNDLENIATNKE